MIYREDDFSLEFSDFGEPADTTWRSQAGSFEIYVCSLEQKVGF